MLSSEFLRSERLELVQVTAEAVRSELAQDGRLGEFVRAEVTSEWPPADWEPHVLELLLATFSRDPEQERFQRYIVLSRTDGSRVLAGCVGGFVWPERPEEIEIGYSILPEFRKGYAFEATQRYVAFVRERAGHLAVVAQTFPHLQASVRILERLGSSGTDQVGRKARSLSG